MALVGEAAQVFLGLSSGRNSQTRSRYSQEEEAAQICQCVLLVSGLSFILQR
jgi:hypothetical protein